MPPWVPCSFYHENATTFYFLTGVKSISLLSERSEKCSRSLAVFRTPTELGWILAQHAWYLGSSWMIPTTVGSAGVQQLLPLLKLRWHPSYERTSIPYHFSFIPKPYSLQATFDTTCTPHFGRRAPWFCLQPPGWVFSATCIIVRVALALSLIVTEVGYQPVVLVWGNCKNI